MAEVPVNVIEEARRAGIEEGIQKERKRVTDNVLAEYKKWRDVDEGVEYGREFDLIAIGATGAAANILVAVTMGNEVDD